MATKLSLKFNKLKFSDLVEKLQDLSSIEDVIKLKIQKDTTLIYTMLSSETQVLALKSYLLDTSDYIENFNDENTFDFIITSASKFVKNLKFLNSDTTIKVDIIYKPQPDEEEIMHVRSAQFTNGKLKISCIGGEEYKIKDIKKELLNQRLNIKNSKWNFKISQSDFTNVKKLCSINNEEKILNISVSNGVVTMNETAKWELEIDNIEPRNTNLVFSKKYLSNINERDFIQFYVFETFILVKDDISNLMLSFETNFDQDE